MEQLWKYHKEENWQYVLKHVVPIEFEKNRWFYDIIKKENIFEDDIYKVLATFASFMFHGKTSEYDLWLNTKQPMLDGFTPREIIEISNGKETLKEYLLRYPKI
jgi:hypothetical protein